MLPAQEADNTAHRKVRERVRQVNGRRKNYEVARAVTVPLFAPAGEPARAKLAQ